jgi:hypothetical protein
MPARGTRLRAHGSLPPWVDSATRGSFHFPASFLMSLSQKKTRPDLAHETPVPLDAPARARLRGALRDRYGERLDVDGGVGTAAAFLACHVPVGRRTHELVVFARAADGGAAHDVLVDYLDGLLEEMHGAGDKKRARGADEGFFLPLDFEGRPYDDGFVFVRGEVRDFEAEKEAARLLGEPLPERLVRVP